MSFNDQRFPDKISRGARSTQRRKTSIVELHSGREERNGSWSASRREYDVSFGVRNMDDIQEVTAYWEAMGGKLYGFRFKDWSDFKSCLQSRRIDARDQWIGLGDGVVTAFQLQKHYTSGAFSYQRRITRPVEGTVRVAVGGAETFDGWSVDVATGLVTFDVAPALGAAITAGFEFDVPCRFDTDDLSVVTDVERIGSISSIPIVELRE